MCKLLNDVTVFYHKDIDEKNDGTEINGNNVPDVDPASASAKLYVLFCKKE
jgi:hypothetical protein